MFFFSDHSCLFLYVSFCVCVYFLIWTLDWFIYLKRGEHPKNPHLIGVFIEIWLNLFINLEKINISNNDKCFYLRICLSICLTYFISISVVLKFFLYRFASFIRFNTSYFIIFRCHCKTFFFHYIFQLDILWIHKSYFCLFCTLLPYWVIVYSKFLVDFSTFLGRQPYCLKNRSFPSSFSIFVFLSFFSYLIALAITSNMRVVIWASLSCLLL